MGGAVLGKAFKGVGEVSASAFSDASFKLGLTGFRERHTDEGFRVVFDDFEVGRCVLPVTAGIEDISK